MHGVVEQAVVVVLLAGEEGSDHGGSVVVAQHQIGRRSLVAFPASEETAVVEHVFGQGVQRPVVAFARVTWFPRDFDEAVVQRQVMPYGVLPGGEFFPVVVESGHYEFTNAAERQFFVWRL